MTDLTPNDLSYLSDKDFNALCPQGHHAPGAEPLSHAAQAVLDAVCTTTEPDCSTEYLVAAALRAAAIYCKRDAVVLMAIADELEGQ